MSYSRWQSGKKDYPRFAWFVGIYSLAFLVGFAILAVSEPSSVTDEEGGWVGLGAIVVAAIGLIVLTRGPVPPAPRAGGDR